MIVLKTNMELKKVFYSLVKNIWKDVEWRDIFVVEGDRLILLGKRRSLVFDFDKKNVESNILEFDIKPDEVIAIENNNTLTNILDMTLYAYGKWGLIRGLRVDKDYEKLNDMFNGVTNSIKVESAITKDNLRFFENGKLLTLEDVVEKLIINEKKEIQQREEIAAEDTMDNGYSMGLWHNMCWKMKHTTFKKTGEIELAGNSTGEGGIGNNFYATNYICPNCGKNLYMAIYPKNREVRIETDDTYERNVYIARIFSCKSCYSFFTPKPQKILAEGDVYELAVDNDKEAFEDYVELISKRATSGSNSEFNEYESQYNARKKNNEHVDNTPDLDELCENIEDMSDEAVARVKNLLEEGFYPQELLKEFYGKIAEEFKERNKKGIKNFFAKKKRDKERKKRWHKPENLEKEESDSKLHTVEDIQEMSSSTVDFVTAMALANEEAKQKEFEEKDKNFEYPIPKFDLPKLDLKLMSTDDLREIFDSLMAGNVYPPEISKKYLREVKQQLNTRLDEEYKSSCDHLEVMAGREVKKLKLRILNEPHISKGLRDDLLGKMNAILSKGTEPQWKAKLEECKGKNYEYVVNLINEVECDAPPTVKETLMETLRKYKNDAAKKEASVIIKKLSGNVSKDEVEECRKKLKKYTELDADGLVDKIQEKKAAAENKKITEFIQKYGVKNRKTLRRLLEDITKQNFKNEYLKPHLERLSKQLYEADKKAIEEICPDPADVTFEEGLRKYDEISRGVFLPELKKNTLELLDKRLYRLKMDECQQLVAKMRKQMEGRIKDYSLLHFYDERKMRKNEDDEESKIIKNAIYGYACDRSKYEFPVLIVNLNKKAEGKKGFVITPDNIYIKNNIEATLMEISKIEKIYAKRGLVRNGIYAKYEDIDNIKVSTNLNMKEYKELAEILNDFVEYLQEKPESRDIRYMAKENHAVKCCYRCGYTYTGRITCPKCGSKQNK